jgi:hypothetical protein
MLDGNFPPPGWMFEIKEIFLWVLNKELEFEVSSQKVKLGIFDS